MTSMYPNNKNIDMFGKTVTWPGVNSEGKFTNGDFNDPDAPPSYIPAETINLVLDNLNNLITSMGLEPNNTGAEQLASLFSATAVAFSGIKRDAHGRAQVAAPEAPDDIARKADIDGVTETSASHAATRGSNAHGATVNATASQIITRDAQGRAQVAAPAAVDDIARKAEVDGVNQTLTSHIAGRGSNVHGATVNAAASQIVMRDASGRAKVAAPVAADDIARKAEIDAVLPAGMIIASPRSSVPGYLLCHGSNASRTTYARLFQAMRDIGFPYGAGDGHSTFTLPNFWGCFLRGAGGNAGGIGVTRQEDAIRNITGGFPIDGESLDWVRGACYISGYPGGASGDGGGAAIGFDAARVVPTAPENRPVNHAIYWHIKY